MKVNTNTKMKPEGEITKRKSELGGNQPPAAEVGMAGFLPVSRVEAVLASLTDKMAKAAMECAQQKRVRNADMANAYQGVKWGLEVACDELRAELACASPAPAGRNPAMITAASTSALEPCVPESCDPRSGAEASRALERRPTPPRRSPTRPFVARGECPACGGQAVRQEWFSDGSCLERMCLNCGGTGVVTPERGSEQGSNNRDEPTRASGGATL